MREGPGSSTPHEANQPADAAAMAALMRGHDWSRSALGPPEQWARALRAAVSMLQDAPVPMWLAWGPELSLVYNASYARMLGSKHPRALGAPVREVWAEIWADVGELVATTLSGQALYRENLPLLVNREGRSEQAWFTFSYSPLRDDDEVVRGVACTVWETTANMLAQRKLAESESRLKALTLASTNVIYRMSADWTRMLELNGQGFVADTPTPSAEWADDYIHPDDRAEVNAAIQQAIRTRSKFELEHRVIQVDGSLGWTLSRAIPVLDERGEIVEWFGTAADVTGRRQAHEALQDTNRTLVRRMEDALAQRKLFATIVESTEAMVQVVDTQGRWLALNRAARHGLGAVYDAEPGVGGNVFEHLAPHAEAWEAAWRTALAGKDHTTLVPFGDPASQPRTYEVSFSTLRHDGGETFGVYQFAVDVTERIHDQQRLKEAEAALRRAQEHESEERYRLAVLATNDAIWDWRMSDGHVVWNKALATLFGHEREESSADWWLEHIHPDDRPRIDASIHAVIEGGGTGWSDEYRFRRVDGSYADIFDRGAVLRDARGEPRRMIGAMLDVTQRKAAETALRESERMFRALFETMDEGFCIIEFFDGPHGPLSDYVHVSANPAYAANAGIPDVVGQKVREMVPDEAAEWVETYRRVLVTGEPVRFERELVATGRFLELAAFRIDPPERRQVAVLFQDITKRRRAEQALHQLNETLEGRVAEELAERIKTQEALRQSQKMEAVGQLTGGLAHDFNNMLAVVIGSLELLGRRSVDGDPRAKRYVDAAKDGARRAAQLTQRLLAFSRQQPLKPESVDANKLVAGMSDLLRRSLGGAIRLETVLAGGLWRSHADPNQLESVILNLAVNGRDAMPDGGRLTVETANCHLDERYAANHLGVPAGQYVMVAVSDTGSGMPAEVVAKAFDPFFTTKEVGRGTGLGLSQVYGFVKQSGGHVKIYSELGQGTVVKVYLPRLANPPSEEAKPDATPEIALGDSGELVLVVEDEAAVRQFSVDALVELGYRVLEADGAAAALKLIDAHPEIALLFTDVVMPEINGRKLADEVLKRRPGLPVLFTTGYTRNAVVHNGVLDPGVHLIGKPFTIEELATRVRALLDSRKVDPAAE
ncbi:PAS domain S-box protein [Variovorax sp. KK3]|uniref:PAS domain S-box protein n=1 Tax=Variovorax sp. KK3 TaxID=1855728 RepID=UPI0009F903CA|nr:PAS domain S-box protein [Variovorax sp. KK3]